MVEDVETGENLYVDTSDPGFRRRFTEAAQQQERQLNAEVKRLGIDLHAIPPRRIDWRYRADGYAAQERRR